MPIYVFKCECGLRFEQLAGFDAAAPGCPSCGGETRKIPAGFSLAGDQRPIIAHEGRHHDAPLRAGDTPLGGAAGRGHGHGHADKPASPKTAAPAPAPKATGGSTGTTSTGSSD